MTTVTQNTLEKTWLIGLGDLKICPCLIAAFRRTKAALWSFYAAIPIPTCIAFRTIQWSKFWILKSYFVTIFQDFLFLMILGFFVPYGFLVIWFVGPSIDPVFIKLWISWCLDLLMFRFVDPWICWSLNKLVLRLFDPFINCS